MNKLDIQEGIIIAVGPTAGYQVCGIVTGVSSSDFTVLWRYTHGASTRSIYPLTIKNTEGIVLIDANPFDLRLI